MTNNSENERVKIRKAVLKLFYHMLSDLRFDAAELSGQVLDREKIFLMTNLFNNVPLMLDKEDVNYSEILEYLEKGSSSNQKLHHWVKENTQL